MNDYILMERESRVEGPPGFTMYPVYNTDISITHIQNSIHTEYVTVVFCKDFNIGIVSQIVILYYTITLLSAHVLKFRGLHNTRVLFVF